MAVNDNSNLVVWLDGKLVKWNDAKVPILTHSLQYGSGIFEGMRAYDTPKGAAIFRLQDHVKRFLRSAKIYAMPLKFDQKQIEDAIVKTVKANKLKSCYIRPFAFYDDQQIGLRTTGKKTSVFVAALPFGAYFGKGRDTGIKCKTSTWHRINSSILPPGAKVSGNYINSIMAKIEAEASGADEAILCSVEGYVAEGSGENIFLVQDNRLLTPPKDADILLGITRDSIIKIAENLGYAVEERNIHKEELYTADEVFFTGTAAEVTPIVSIDGRHIGNGKPGPITRMFAEKYSDVVNGRNEEFSGWLTYA
ncbi:MAG: branched-chain amino acid transaminase [Candidatus Micrarchaeota archaeon]|nr:branched-chain amino acid transaminase [Candidatus Micrarchaeota archaeon]